MALAFVPFAVVAGRDPDQPMYTVATLEQDQPGGADASDLRASASLITPRVRMKRASSRTVRVDASR